MLSAITLALLVGCNDGLLDTEDVNKDKVVEEIDEEPPLIVHDPVTGTHAFGVDVVITATVTDNVRVAYVWLFYKNEVDGASDWEKVNMLPSGENVYTGTISGDDHRGGGVDYYIETSDLSQNEAWAPEDGPDDPYHFRIAE